jgi:hypothetical protein
MFVCDEPYLPINGSNKFFFFFLLLFLSSTTLDGFCLAEAFLANIFCQKHFFHSSTPAIFRSPHTLSHHLLLGLPFGVFNNVGIKLVIFLVIRHPFNKDTALDGEVLVCWCGKRHPELPVRTHEAAFAVKPFQCCSASWMEGIHTTGDF